MEQPRIDPGVLNGLSLGEAFHAHVLNDPGVVSLAKSALRDSLFDRVIRDGQYPSKTIEHLWPLYLDVENLAFHFVTSETGFLLAGPFPTASKQVVDLSALLISRIGALRDVLAGGSVVARGTFAASGLVTEINGFEWRRRSVLIDLQNSDVLQQQDAKPKWTGVSLTAVHKSVSSTNPEPKSIPITEARHRRSAQRESIQAAIKGLWPDGIPPGLQVQVRDRHIIQWQHDNGLAPADPRTIRRVLDGK